MIDYIVLAAKNLRTRQKRSILTMIGIFIGIAAVVSLISLGQGMEDAINEQFSSIGGDKILIQAKSPGFGPPGSTAAGKVTDDDLKIVQRAKGIKSVAGRLIKTGKFRYNDKVRFHALTSIPNDDPESIELVLSANNYEIVEGRMLKSRDRAKVVIGDGLADKQKWGKELKVGNKIEINDKKFDVVGKLKPLGDPFRNVAVIMNQEPLRELLEIDDEELSIIVAQVQPSADPIKISEALKRDLRRSRGEKEGRETVEIQTSDQVIQSFFIILDIVQAVLVGIALISLLVGGIGIMNTMYTAALERTREIGIMKSIGARDSSILLIFLFESGMLGLFGGLIGVILGIMMSKSVEYIASIAWGENLLQASVPPELIIGALGFSFIVGTLSGLFPAKHAASLEPVEALRHV